MPKFRKKPIVVEAEQFFSDRYPHPAGVESRMQQYDKDLKERVYFIPTLDGKLYVSQGDWVITGIRGEKYPCKPEIFSETYEPVDD